MDITLQYFEGCPNWTVADERLRQALADAGVAAEVRYQVIESDEQAAALAFKGSPTVLFDGDDPFPAPEGVVGLSCRTYRTEEGQEESPSLRQLAAAIAARA